MRGNPLSRNILLFFGEQRASSASSNSKSLLYYSPGFQGQQDSSFAGCSTLLFSKRWERESFLAEISLFVIPIKSAWGTILLSMIMLSWMPRVKRTRAFVSERTSTWEEIPFSAAKRDQYSWMITVIFQPTAVSFQRQK